PPNVFENLAGRASRERHSRERPALPVVAQEKGDVAGASNGKDVSGRKPERAGLGAVRLRREDLQLAAIALVTVDDGLSAGSEPRVLNRSAPEGELAKARRRRIENRLAREERQDGARSECGDDRDGQGHRPPP